MVEEGAPWEPTESPVGAGPHFGSMTPGGMAGVNHTVGVAESGPFLEIHMIQSPSQAPAHSQFLGSGCLNYFLTKGRSVHPFPCQESTRDPGSAPGSLIPSQKRL